MLEFKTKEEVHNRGVAAIGKTMGELMAAMPEKKSGKKSQVGDAWESWFGVDKNSIAGADLLDAGVELKATAVKETKNGKSAKERLVLNIINYIEEYQKTFETSSFWKKNRLMELGFYEWDKNTDWLEWKIVKSVLFTYPEKDLLIIKKDWELIQEYIDTGRAHELSEGLTMYLGACSKGANKNSLRDQHPSLDAPKAMQRAFSLKSGYMTYLLREYVFGTNEDPNIRVKPFETAIVREGRASYYSQESIIRDLSVLEDKSLEEYIIEKLSPYVDKTVDEIAQMFSIQRNDKGSYPKNINAMIASRMLGLYGDLEKSEEFFKANVFVKTINVESSGTLKESMSFPTFKIKELVQETWEESTLRTMFSEDKFFFVVFQKQDDGSVKFKGAKFWFMPVDLLETTVKDAWEESVQIYRSGVELTYDAKRNRVTNNLIGKSDGKIIHIRPHASKASYVEYNPNADELPVPARWHNKPADFSDSWITKQCFWLNSDFILEQIQELL